MLSGGLHGPAGRSLPRSRFLTAGPIRWASRGRRARGLPACVERNLTHSATSGWLVRAERGKSKTCGGKRILGAGISPAFHGRFEYLVQPTKFRGSKAPETKTRRPCGKLPSSMVLAALDPGRDRQAQFFSRCSSLCVEGVLLQQREERLHCGRTPCDRGSNRAHGRTRRVHGLAVAATIAGIGRDGWASGGIEEFANFGMEPSLQR